METEDMGPAELREGFERTMRKPERRYRDVVVPVTQDTLNCEVRIVTTDPGTGSTHRVQSSTCRLDPDGLTALLKDEEEADFYPGPLVLEYQKHGMPFPVLVANPAYLSVTDPGGRTYVRFWFPPVQTC